MTSPLAAEPPEALGPGQADASGSVSYGSASDAPRASAAAAAALLPPVQQAGASPRCGHCAGIPDPVLAALRAAFHDAEQKGRRGR
jgi:hypothetical protein